MANVAKPKRKSENDDIEKLHRLVKRARSGDESVLPELKKMLDENSSIWRQVGDLTKHAEAAWLDVIGQQDLLLRECVQREIQRLRRLLQKTCTSVLEKHLVDQILTTFLQTKHAELCLAAVEQGPLKQREHYAKRVEQCNRRYSTAIAQLLKSRELLGTVQTEITAPKNAPKTQKAILRAAKALKKAQNRSLRIVSA